MLEPPRISVSPVPSKGLVEPQPKIKNETALKQNVQDSWGFLIGSMRGRAPNSWTWGRYWGTWKNNLLHVGASSATLRSNSKEHGLSAGVCPRCLLNLAGFAFIGRIHPSSTWVLDLVPQNRATWFGSNSSRDPFDVFCFHARCGRFCRRKTSRCQRGCCSTSVLNEKEKELGWQGSVDWVPSFTILGWMGFVESTSRMIIPAQVQHHSLGQWHREGVRCRWGWYDQYTSR